MIKQRTLREVVHIAGIGLHTGKAVAMTVHPAAENTGIVLRRVDLDPIVLIPATTNYVSDTQLNTCLAHENVFIATVEHLLSAFAGLHIDNACIDLTASEPPAMDGSAQPFVQMLQAAGLLEQTADKQFIRINREVRVEEAGKFAMLAPFAGCRISMTIDFNHPVIAQSQRSLSIDLSPTSYSEQISFARTFGFLSEYEHLRKNNLGLGAGLENTLVLDETAVINEGGLRDNAEFVKHKILDTIGDLYLLGHNFIGEFSGYKSGHTLNHHLRQALLTDTSAWELVTQPAF